MSDTTDKNHDKPLSSGRRDAVRNGLGLAAGIAVAALSGTLARRSAGDDMVWQLDPDRCIQCEKCSTNCVLPQSAVRCLHSYAMCGYCDLCSGYLKPGALARDTAAEHQLCPTGAIERTFIEDPYFQYRIDEELCIGCAKCVKGCGAFGNGSLFLQVRHDICLNCNDCSIARSCPADAWRRVPASEPYILRGAESAGDKD